LLQRYPFVRDGLLSIALAIVWSACGAILCKPGGIICAFSHYLLDLVMRPAQQVIGRLFELVLNVTGLVLPAPDAAIDRRIDIMATSTVISLLLLYWFFLGALICKIWRFARGRLRLLLGNGGPKS
jgi:hypothetical protein